MCADVQGGAGELHSLIHHCSAVKMLTVMEALHFADAHRCMALHPRIWTL